MPSLKRILLAVPLADDDWEVSPAIRTAFRHAAALASAAGCELSLLTVVNPQPSERGTGPEQTHSARRMPPESLRQLIEGELDQWSQMWSQVPVSTAVVEGDAGEEIVRSAVRQRADIVVVACGDQPAIDSGQDRLLGELLADCPCPLWIVSGAAGAAGAADRNEQDVVTVMAVDDLTESALGALHLAVSVAQSLDARLLVLHAASATQGAQASEVDPLEGREEALRRQMANRLSHTDYRCLSQGCRLQITQGAVQSSITQVAKEHDVDLIVLAAGAPDEALVRETLRATRRAVLVIPVIPASASTPRAMA